MHSINSSSVLSFLILHRSAWLYIQARGIGQVAGTPQGFNSVPPIAWCRKRSMFATFFYVQLGARKGHDIDSRMCVGFWTSSPQSIWLNSSVFSLQWPVPTRKMVVVWSARLSVFMKSLLGYGWPPVCYLNADVQRYILLELLPPKNKLMTLVDPAFLFFFGMSVGFLISCYLAVGYIHCRRPQALATSFLSVVRLCSVIGLTANLIKIKHVLVVSISLRNSAYTL